MKKDPKNIDKLVDVWSSYVRVDVERNSNVTKEEDQNVKRKI